MSRVCHTHSITPTRRRNARKETYLTKTIDKFALALITPLSPQNNVNTVSLVILLFRWWLTSTNNRFQVRNLREKQQQLGGAWSVTNNNNKYRVANTPVCLFYLFVDILK